MEVGSWGAWSKLGVHPNEGRGFFRRNFVHSVIANAAGTRAFLSYWDLGTVILDISNPANPIYLGRTPATGNPEGDALGRAHQQGEAPHRDAGVARRHAALLRHLEPASPPARGPFQAAGVPPQPGEGQPFFADSVHDVKVAGKVAYFSWYRQGVVAVDITKPSRPRLVARFRPAGGDFWGVAVTSSYILASDMPSGMYVLRLVGLRQATNGARFPGPVSCVVEGGGASACGKPFPRQATRPAARPPPPARRDPAEDAAAVEPAAVDRLPSHAAGLHRPVDGQRVRRVLVDGLRRLDV